MCTGLLTKPHIPNNLCDQPGNFQACAVEHRAFLVERFTGTQCSQGLWGKPAWEESYTSLLEKAVAPYPPKQNPTIKWHKQVRDPLWSVMERVLQQLWYERCSSGAEPGTQGLRWSTSEGLRAVSSHLYCSPGRREGSGHQSGNHQASRSGTYPTCAHWRLAGRRGCCTGKQAAPWITLVPCPPPLVLALSPRCQRD